MPQQSEHRSYRGGSTPPLSARPEAGEFLALYRIQGGALMHWRKESIDDRGAPLLGAACKALLESERGELLIFDFSIVRELSTQALPTLSRFQNAVDCLKQRLLVRTSTIRSSNSMVNLPLRASPGRASAAGASGGAGLTRALRKQRP